MLWREPSSYTVLRLRSSVFPASVLHEKKKKEGVGEGLIWKPFTEVPLLAIFYLLRFLSPNANLERPFLRHSD